MEVIKGLGTKLHDGKSLVIEMQLHGTLITNKLVQIMH